MTNSRLTLRRLALAGSGLTFASIALASLVAPEAVAPAYGLFANGVGGKSEIRAVFMGFCLPRRGAR